MKTLIPLLLLALTVGCKSPGLTKTMVQTAVATGVTFGVMKEPRAIPYLRASVPVICSAAHGTNLNPAEIVAALENSPAGGLKTPQSILIMNGIIGIYTGVYEAYGQDIDDRPFLQAALDGTCEGLKQGLPPEGAGPEAVKVFRVNAEAKPHIK